MKNKERKRKHKALIAVLSVFAIVIAAAVIVVPKVDTEGFRHILGYALTSFVKPKTNESVDAYLEKIGGFAKGVCHPNENFDQIKDANIKWVRFDCASLPYDEDGNPTDGYLAYKMRAKAYSDRGFKVMCVTPYPSKFIEAGYDPRTEAGKEKIREYAEFYAKDLQGIVSAFQVTNEMGIEHFTLPLTLEEAAEFIGIQLEAMNDVKGNIVAGYNLAGTVMYSLTKLMKPYLDYTDYVGIDIYLGCFENVFKYLFVNNALMRFVWSYTGKPVMLNEFGYMGYGDVKSEEQKKEILRTYGVESEEEARENIIEFIKRLPKKFSDHMLSLEYSSEEELAHKLFDTELSNHLYREIKGGFQLANYRHTPEDQGRFFTDMIKKIRKNHWACGAIVYCYSDSDSCYICGQTDCPIETGWGLVDGKGEPKPAYYAVQAEFAK